MESNQYTYLPIRSALTCLNTKVNIYGVIKEYEPPKSTKGTDKISTMTIVDMSYHSPGLRLNLFAPQLSAHPCVKAIGDIIRLHRVKIESHNNTINAVARRRYSTFLLFEGKHGTSYNPYQHSHEHYDVMGQDEKIISSLRSWLNSSPLHTGESDYTVPIRSIKEGVYFDLNCKVLFVSEIAENSSIIFVWDGTDAPPKEFEMKKEDAIDADPLEESSIFPLPRNALCNFPSVGTVLKVFVEMPISELQPRLPEISHWVKLRNMTCRTRSGLWEGVMSYTSKIYKVPSETEERYERESTERFKTESACLPQWCPNALDHLTVTKFQHIKFSTLMHVIIHPQKTFISRCIVRVIASFPSKVEEFCGERKNSENKIEYFYRVRLTLEDPTARIHAYLYGEDANDFFQGYPAASFKGSNTSLNELKTKFDKLLGVNKCNDNEGETPRVRNPPWVECCIQSYYLDKDSPWESRHHRIFGTTLRG